NGFHIGMDFAGVFESEVRIKFDMGEKISLGKDHERSAMENTGILEGLVFPFGNAEQHDFRGLAEVVTGGANEIADIFHEEKAGSVKAQFGEMAVDHASVKMAGAAGDDLTNGKTEAGEAPSVVIGLKIA